MFNNDIFDRNIIALSEKNPELSSRLRKADTQPALYKFLESKRGDIIPAWLSPNETVQPLHSMMDPKKEAGRLLATVESESFLVLLGLGGAYYVEAALARNDIGVVFVIEYGLSGLAELLGKIDYSRFFKDARFRIFVDASDKELEENILDLYQPVLYGGIKVLPMRSRTGQDLNQFIMAGNAIQAAIDRVSRDYSVQAHFGKRWFSNIIRNIRRAETSNEDWPEINRAAITAAGPSLSMQIPDLRKKRNALFLIATDTSLPCLLHEGLVPDVVVSIDCQQISYYHFMDGLPESVLLFLDLASPPLLSGLTKNCRFFSTGHPLTRYISTVWKATPLLDTSGGNVTYAALSLAEQLGAEKIELYGADFSYPCGVSYARGAYIYPYFEKMQNRFNPLEAQSSAFLYRTPLAKISSSNKVWYYETETLKFYRLKLEEKSEKMEAEIIPAAGGGALLNLRQKLHQGKTRKDHSNDKAAMKAEKFLEFYRDEIKRLPKPEKNAAEYLASLREKERIIFSTIIPLAAAIKKSGDFSCFTELLEEAKAYSISQIKASL